MGGERRAAICAFIVFLSILASGQASAEDPLYLTEYRLYDQAFAAGDRAGAAQHGLAAWKAAEQSLGDHPTTAVLAYNYGRLVAFDDPGAALPALRRADALTKSVGAEIPPDELALLLAFAEFYTSKRRSRDAAALRRVLEEQAKRNVPHSLESAEAWLLLATEDIKEERYRDAVASAAGAEAAIVALSPQDYRTRAGAILIGGAARLAPFPRETKDIEAAHVEFERASLLFPPQKNIESFDELFAQAITWDEAARALLMNRGRTEFRSGCAMNEKPCNLAMFEGPNATNEECGIEWERRPPPSYPPGAILRGYMGAVFVGFRLGDDMIVSDARVLAEVPAEKFSKAVFDAMKKWKLARPPADRSECRNNRLAIVMFTIED